MQILRNVLAECPLEGGIQHDFMRLFLSVLFPIGDRFPKILAMVGLEKSWDGSWWRYHS